jgi:uncharacterized protein YjlB
VKTVYDIGNVAGFVLEDDGAFPSSILPVILYRREVNLAGTRPGDLAEDLLCRHGWSGKWQNGIYNFRHFHSNAHEALIIARGYVKVGLGGNEGPAFDLSAGDAVVLPAGTGHVNLGSSEDLLVVGGYPPGQEKYDIHKGDPAEHEAMLKNIRAVPLPVSDPVRRSGGVVMELWVANEGN